nr:hypothetical protein [Tanacetum cinerariifolium]
MGFKGITNVDLDVYEVGLSGKDTFWGEGLKENDEGLGIITPWGRFQRRSRRYVTAPKGFSTTERKGKVAVHLASASPAQAPTPEGKPAKAPSSLPAQDGSSQSKNGSGRRVDLGVCVLGSVVMFCMAFLHIRPRCLKKRFLFLIRMGRQQEYMQKVVEDVGEDDDFKSGA